MFESIHDQLSVSFLTFFSKLLGIGECYGEIVLGQLGECMHGEFKSVHDQLFLSVIIHVDNYIFFTKIAYQSKMSQFCQQFIQTFFRLLQIYFSTMLSMQIPDLNNLS